ncbi:alpha/beta hydrolase [Granulibacter bethesdensis]|nr:alpha/beta hydrolase [Granulibacter bethesdensis]
MTWAVSGWKSSENFERLSLWPDQPPGGRGPAGPIRIDDAGAVSHIAVPYVEVYRPINPDGRAVLIAAGGGYRRIMIQKEARPAARWLVAQGMTAFVLYYRLPDEGWDQGPLAPFQDAQRALRVIRAHAAQYMIDQRRVSVLGFSAGGHLMGLTACRSAFLSYQPVDDWDALSARPMGAALVYPIVTLMPPYDHTSTRIALVGDHPSMAQRKMWSIETYIRARCPPFFLVQAQDDAISDPDNTTILEQACLHGDVPVERHVLSEGGHGFGIGKAGSQTAKWPGWYKNWMLKNI